MESQLRERLAFTEDMIEDARGEDDGAWGRVFGGYKYIILTVTTD